MSAASASTEMSGDKPRVLIATDCLSEGINLQELFTGVLHYDLPWNPNRLEQREGRVDRFGQQAAEVKACLLYGADNPIDGIVLDVLLRKVREIKRATGINVPFPEDSQSIIDTITQALLLNPDRRIERVRGKQQQMLFDFDSFEEAAAAKDRVTRKVDEAASRETASRSIFAQHAIKAHEIEEDLRAVDEAIGDPKAVQDFVISTLSNLLGVQVIQESKGFAHRACQPAASAPGSSPRRQTFRHQANQGQFRVADARGLSLPGPQSPFCRATVPVCHGEHSCLPRQTRRTGAP